MFFFPSELSNIVLIAASTPYPFTLTLNKCFLKRYILDHFLKRYICRNYYTFGVDNYSSQKIYSPTTQRAFSYITENDRLPIQHIKITTKEVMDKKCKTLKDKFQTLKNVAGHIENTKH